MKERFQEKARIKEIYGNRCANWKDERFSHGGRLTIHHIVFKSDGGKNEKGNLIALCEECHSFVHEIAGNYSDFKKKG